MKHLKRDGNLVLRLLLTTAVVVGVGLFIAQKLGVSSQQKAQEDLEADVMNRLLGQAVVQPTQPVAFADSDGDLVTDPPADEACVSPEQLVFSYIARDEPGEEPAAWADVTAAISKRVGLPVEYRHFKTTQEQLNAFASGELHVMGLSTGTVPLAVASAGYVPVCVMGREDGNYGYLMKALAPADAPFDDLAGFAALPREQRRVAFTSPTSNSGFKAAFIGLMTDHDLRPERDYDWVFSSGHERSAELLVAGEVNLAPVASDLLDRMIADGAIEQAALKTVYESERFPPAAIGYAHNLAPALRDGVREALLAFTVPGSSLEKRYGAIGAARLVAVSYKDDWANIRRIDEAFRSAR